MKRKARPTKRWVVEYRCKRCLSIHRHELERKQDAMELYRVFCAEMERNVEILRICPRLPRRRKGA